MRASQKEPFKLHSVEKRESKAHIPFSLNYQNSSKVTETQYMSWLIFKRSREE